MDFNSSAVLPPAAGIICLVDDDPSILRALDRLLSSAGLQQAPAAAQPTPVVALAISGMNDVLNSQGYTQAAWWNRTPFAAWGMMAAIAICCNLFFGYGARKREAEGILMLVLPIVVSISFFLIADTDSPRGGFILLRPQKSSKLRSISAGTESKGQPLK
jgi:hypothetical protein